jgi:ParB/RepB/Spo0J family partition protein
MAPAAATAPVSDMGNFESLPLALIDFSATNEARAKSYDKKKLGELADSIKQKGVIEAIVVRRKGSRFEVIAGQRRTVASRLAGRSTIKAEIRDLSDEEALEFQVIENLQREDAHPLDEAEGYRQLMAMNAEKHTPEHVAAAVGKDKSYIYKRLKLLSLIGKAQKLFREGAIGPAHAILLARLQPKDQGRVLDEVFRHDDSVSVGRLQSYIERTILLDLKKAPFDTADAQLVPAAGACLTCPKRTGCAPALFEDIKSGDTCTDPACYQEKQKAGLERTLAELRAKHGDEQVVVLLNTNGYTGHESNALKAAWPAAVTDGFVRAGKDACDHTRYALAVSDSRYAGPNYSFTTGDVFKACLKSNTCKVHKEKRETFDSGRGVNVDAAQREKERKHRHEQKVWAAAKKAIFDKAIEKITDPDHIAPADLRMLASFAFDRLEYDRQKMIVPFLAWDADAWQKNRSKFPDQQIAKAAVPELLRILYACALATDFFMSSSPWFGKPNSDRLYALAGRLKVNARSIEDGVRKAMPLPTKAKASTAPAKAAKKAKKR